MDKVIERIRQWKLLADVFIRNDSKVFIKTFNGDLHFCKIVLNGEDSITVDNFAPEQRAGTRDRIYWFQIQIFDECRSEK